MTGFKYKLISADGQHEIWVMFRNCSSNYVRIEISNNERGPFKMISPSNRDYYNFIITNFKQEIINTFYKMIYLNQKPLECKEDCELPETPDHIKNAELKPHQKLLLKNALKKEKNLESDNYFDVTSDRDGLDRHYENIRLTNTVIGDHVGSGKSYMIMALAHGDINSKHEDHIKFTPDKNIKTNVIVIPHNIMPQWEKYLKDHYTGKVYPIKTKKSIRRLVNGYKYDDSGDNLPISGRIPKPTKKEDEPSISYLSDYYHQPTDAQKNCAKKMGTIRADELRKFNVILVSNTMYNRFAWYLNKDIYEKPFIVSRLFIDEADNIKLSKARQIYAKMTYFVTSSISNLLIPNGIDFSVARKYDYRNGHEYEIRINMKGINHHGFIKDTFVDLFCTRTTVGIADSRHLMDMYKVDNLRKYFQEIFLFNKLDYIDESFKIPDVSEYVMICKTSTTVNILQNLVPDEVINRLNAGDVSGAIDYLGIERNTTESVVNAITKKYKDKLVSLEEKFEAEFATLPDDDLNKIRITKKISELKSKISGISQRVSNYDYCPICMDSMDQPTIVSCCQNVLCFECITTSVAHKPICPMCRENIDPKKDLKVVDNEVSDEVVEEVKEVNEDIITLEKLMAESAEKEKKTNLKQLISYINSIEKTPKLIIGCDSTTTEPFATMANTLDELGIKFETLKGHSTTINKMVMQYKDNGEISSEQDRLNALLMNTHNFASGTNLENTTDIILYHKMDKAMETQIIGRAQRPGRTQSLRVWKLFNSYELQYGY